MTPFDRVDFCLSKCGSGYCGYMTSRTGFPCIEYICAFCEHKSEENCKFCKEGR